MRQHDAIAGAESLSVLLISFHVRRSCFWVLRCWRLQPFMPPCAASHKTWRSVTEGNEEKFTFSHECHPSVPMLHQNKKHSNPSKQERNPESTFFFRTHSGIPFSGLYCTSECKHLHRHVKRVPCPQFDAAASRCLAILNHLSQASTAARPNPGNTSTGASGRNWCTCVLMCRLDAK